MKSSPRYRVLKELRRASGDVRQGSYYVKRGVINWASFDFNARPRAIAIHMDEMSLGREPFDSAKVTFEIAASMPEDLLDPQIDDGLLDELMDDAEKIIDELIASRDTTNEDYPTVFKLVKNSIIVIEFHDAELRVQGIVVSFQVDF